MVAVQPLSCNESEEHIRPRPARSTDNMSLQQGEELTREQAAMTNLSIHIGCFEQNTLSCARCDIPFTDQEPVLRKRTCGCAMHVPCAIEVYAHGNPCAGCNRDPSRGIYPTEADLSRKTQTFRTISQAETMYHGSTDEAEPEIAEHQVHIEDFRDEQIRGVMHEMWRLFTTHESAFLRRTQSFLFADSQVQADYERLLWRMGDIIRTRRFEWLRFQDDGSELGDLEWYR